MSGPIEKRVIFGIKCERCRRILHIHVILLRCVYCGDGNIEIISMDYPDQPYSRACPGCSLIIDEDDNDYRETPDIPVHVTKAFQQLSDLYGPPPLSCRLFHRLKCALSTKEDENLKCPICLEVLGEGMTLIILNCDHKFHEDCANAWLRQHETCPTCRVHQDPGYESIVRAIARNEGSGNRTCREDTYSNGRTQSSATDDSNNDMTDSSNWSTLSNDNNSLRSGFSPSYNYSQEAGDYSVLSNSSSTNQFVATEYNTNNFMDELNNISTGAINATMETFNANNIVSELSNSTEVRTPEQSLDAIDATSFISKLSSFSAQSNAENIMSDATNIPTHSCNSAIDTGNFLLEFSNSVTELRDTPIAEITSASSPGYSVSEVSNSSTESGNTTTQPFDNATDTGNFVTDFKNSATESRNTPVAPYSNVFMSEISNSFIESRNISIAQYSSASNTRYISELNYYPIETRNIAMQSFSSTTVTNNFTSDLNSSVTDLRNTPIAPSSTASNTEYSVSESSNSSLESTEVTEQPCYIPRETHHFMPELNDFTTDISNNATDAYGGAMSPSNFMPELNHFPTYSDNIAFGAYNTVPYANNFLSETSNFSLLSRNLAPITYNPAMLPIDFQPGFNTYIEARECIRESDNIQLLSNANIAPYVDLDMLRYYYHYDI